MNEKYPNRSSMRKRLFDLYQTNDSNQRPNHVQPKQGFGLLMFRVDHHTYSASQIHQVVHAGTDIQEPEGNKQIRANDQNESDPANLLKVFVRHWVDSTPKLCKVDNALLPTAFIGKWRANDKAVCPPYKSIRMGLTDPLSKLGNAAIASRSLVSQLRLSCNI